MDLRPVLYVIGIFLCVLAVSMALPLLVDLYFDNDDWKTFFLCIMITAFFGGSLVLCNASDAEFTLSVRQVFLLTGLSWLVLAVFAAFPIWLSSLEISFTDALFEATSGITTTGATVIVGLDYAPPGILLWRALLQWLGGIGIIVMALSVLPFLKVGGMQLFRTESSENEKALPRAAQLASSIGIIYLALTLVCAAAYHASGLRIFDSVAHAMTTIATGGFSTFDTSFAHFHHASTEIVATIFMILGGLPFILYLKAVRGDIMPLLRDSQVRWFLSIIAGVTLCLVLYLANHHEIDMSFGEAVQRSAFNVVSVITGTGYANHDYSAWGSFGTGVFFFLMVVGGCAGSTTCGIKIFRFQILYAVATVQLKKLMYPNGVFVPHYNGKPVPDSVPASVMGFFFVYALCFTGLAIILSMFGLDFLTAASGAATAISNVGPGLGEIIGPASTFKTLPDGAKWVLCGGMLLGRLEIFTLLILFTPGFWRR